MTYRTTEIQPSDEFVTRTVPFGVEVTECQQCGKQLPETAVFRCIECRAEFHLACPNLRRRGVVRAGGFALCAHHARLESQRKRKTNGNGKNGHSPLTIRRSVKYGR